MNKSFIFTLIVSFSLFASESFNKTLSFQGYTGVINTPNAQVIDEGHMLVHFNNQFDNSIVSYDYDKYHRYQEDYIVGFGLFSCLEIEGRLSEARGFHRDLSVNIKVQLPYHHKYLPDIALGVQDLGGAANYYDNQYIVLDKNIWNFRLSGGYGHSSSEYKKRVRMDGLFGALEYQIVDWLSIMVENDTKENHAAVRLQTPQPLLWDSRFDVTLSQNFTSKETSFGFTLDIPLYNQDDKKSTTITKIDRYNNIESNNSNSVIHSQMLTEPIKKVRLSTLEATYNYTSDDLKEYLVKFGFENVRVVKKRETLYIEAENSVFDYNDLDALGYLIGMASFSDNNMTNYNITLLKNNIVTLNLSGNCMKFKNYIIDANPLSRQALEEDLVVSRDVNRSMIFKNQKVSASSFFKPRIAFAPSLITAVGTDYGVFDYILYLRTKLSMNLYKGLSVSATYQLPLLVSDEYKEGGHYYSSSKLESKVRNIMLHQTFHYKNMIDTLSYGKFLSDYIGVMNQLHISTTDGTHAFLWRAGQFSKDNGVYKSIKRDYSLGTYRYFYAPMDLYAEVTYGKYWSGDIGYQLNFKRFFGDVNLDLYYKSSHFLEQKDVKFAGMAISFPITLRKLYNSKYIQFKGTKEFYYGLRTVVNNDDGRNPLNGSNALIPISDSDLLTTYLNRDRLGSSYIKMHIQRLREAYLKYKDD